LLTPIRKIEGNAVTAPQCTEEFAGMMKPKIKKSEETRRRILLAAAQAFAEGGFKGTTVRKICGKAEANIASIKYYFGSKEQLYIDTFKFLYEETGMSFGAERPLEVNNAEEWHKALHQWTRQMLGHIMAEAPIERWRGRLFTRERTSPSQVLPIILDKYILPIYRRLNDLLQMAYPEDITPAEMNLWSVGIISQCIVYADREPPWDKLLFTDDMPRSEWLELATKHIVAGITSRLHFQRSLSSVSPVASEA
jgi:AcrR family transcriptional regulator